MKILGTIRKIGNSKANSINNYILYPQFEIQKDNSLRRIVKDEFPNRGTIFITGFQDPMGLSGNSIVLVDADLQVMSMYENMKDDQNTFKYSIYGGNNNIRKVVSSQLVEIIEVNDGRTIKDIIENEQARYLQLSTTPLNNRVLLMIDNYIYGAFTYIPGGQSDDTIKIKLSIKEGLNKHGEYSIYKYPKEAIINLSHIYNRFVINNNDTAERTSNFDIIPQRFILDVKDLDGIDILDELDFIDDKTLLNLIQTTLSNEKLYEITKSTLKDIKDLASNSTKLSFAKERAERLALILTNSEQMAEFRKVLLKSFFGTHVGEEYAKDFIKNNQEVWQSALDEIPEYKEEKDRFASEKQAKIAELQELRNQIEQAKTERDKQKKEIEEEQLKEIEDILVSKNKNISELEELIIQKRTELDELLDKLHLLNDIEKLKREKERAQITYNDTVVNIRSMETTLQTKIAELNESYVSYEKRLLENVISKKENEMTSSIMRLMQPKHLSIEDCSDEYSYKEPNNKVENNITIEVVLERFEKTFESVNRTKSREEILNYLICITQRLTTVFAGAPGTGKTSLVTLIAKALGLYNERFTQVSVERNWTSYKDWVGYHNPLTGKIEKAATGVFDTFEKLTYESDNGINIPQFILLDEANLSPIEHYWSKFLLACDPLDKSKNTFDISENCSFNLPESLKFLATINFDHTTEVLSERFLDRVWVILIENFEPSYDEYEENFVPNNDTLISYDILVDLFSTNDAQLDEHLAMALKAIMQVYIENKKILSPRSFEAVKKYCVVAQKYADYMEGKYKPLDYAVGQKILPLINGYGEGYKKLLDGLLSVFNRFDMGISIKILEEILERGKEQHGYYQFFGSR